MLGYVHKVESCFLYIYIFSIRNRIVEMEKNYFKN